MISLDQYWNGRDVKYKSDLTADISANAIILLTAVNNLLGFAKDDGIDINTVASGWRPPSVNDATSNAAAKSKHITGHGIDLRDDHLRSFAHWCVKNPDLLVEWGLWMEHPGWTGGPGHTNWVHLQDLPPGSGKRIYIPSSKPPFDSEFVV